MRVACLGGIKQQNNSALLKIQTNYIICIIPTNDVSFTNESTRIFFLPDISNLLLYIQILK